MIGPSLQLISREIRAFIGWPKSRITVAGKVVIVTSAHVSDNDSGEPGSFKILDKTIMFHCGKQSLVIDRLKPSGKNEMTSASFIAGYGSLLK